MRGIRLLLVALIILVGIGFYRGWFTLSKSKAGLDGNKVNINMSVDEGKMKSDIKNAQKKVKEEIQVIEDKVKARKATQQPAN
jgi:hypothetical protein